jgi:hypothetical protein
MNHFSRVKQRDAEIDTSAATADRAVSHEDEVTEFVTTKDSVIFSNICWARDNSFSNVCIYTCTGLPCNSNSMYSNILCNIKT